MDPSGGLSSSAPRPSLGDAGKADNMQNPAEAAVNEDRMPSPASQLPQMALTKITTCAAVIFDQPLMLHIGAVLLLLWLASAFRFSSIWIFIIAFWFLYEVDKIYILRTRRQLRSEERRSASQRRPLSDFEQAEWLNQVVKLIWPHFLEEFVSKDLLTDLIPWFLDKYKPWTIRKTALRHLYLGRSSPTFTGIRTLERTSDDDHLVMDMCLDFLAADDMDAVLAVQMRRRLGLGIWTNIHISKLQIEGKVRVGVRFSKDGPFLSRVRLCFENPPYVQMTAKPLSTHGMNVSELPLVAGWMERMVADVFEQSLVEPNMLVIDVTRLLERIIIPKATPTLGKWFEIQERPPIAIAQVDVLEAMDLKPSDMNGLADPFVKGAFATCRFKTKIQKKTLNPKWHEEFKVPVASWELPTLLVLHVRDKDQFRDDDLGFCELDLAEYRGGQRHDMWIPLKDIKMGRLHVAVKVTETVQEVGSMKQGLSSMSFQSNASAEDDASMSSVGEKSFLDDSFETINMGRGEDGFVSIMRPGQPGSRYWRQRKGTSRRNHQPTPDPDTPTTNRPAAYPDTPGANDPSSSSSSMEEEGKEAKPMKRRIWRWHTSEPPQSSKADCKETLTVGDKGTTVRMKLEDPTNGNRMPQLCGDGGKKGIDPLDSGSFDTTSLSESPTAKSHMKNLAKGIKKHAERTAQNLTHALSRKGSGKNEEEHLEGGSTLVDDTSLAESPKKRETTAGTEQL